MIGKSGKILIHIFAFRLVFLAIDCRAASICRELRIPASAAFKPTVPNVSLVLNSNFTSFPIPVQTLNSNINYGESVAYTSNGTFGIKVWTYIKASKNYHV